MYVCLKSQLLFSLKRKLCEAPYNKTLDWSKWYVFWAEERAVAKNHAESNYKLTKEEFLSKVYHLSIRPSLIFHALNLQITEVFLFHRAQLCSNFHSYYLLLHLILLCFQHNHIKLFMSSCWRRFFLTWVI